MISQLRSLCCFCLALNLFLTLVLFLPLQKLAPDVQKQIEEEKIITAVQGYPKHLDSFYFNLASLIVPISAFLFSQILFSRLQLKLVFGWSVSLLWLIGLMGYVVIRYNA